jgi:uncharacterized protein (TIGR02266 family)
MTGDGTERRQHARIAVRLKVKVAQKDVGSFVESQIANISEGGIFIQTRTPKPPGTLVRFEILLKGGQTILRGDGQVTWIRPEKTSEGTRQIPGMGVKFLALDKASKTLVDRIIAAKLRQHPAQAKTPQPAPRDPSEAAADEFDLDDDLDLDIDLDESPLPARSNGPEPRPSQAQPASPRGPQQESGPNRRQAPRITCGLIVQAKHEDLDEFIEGYAVNISDGGIFIRSQNPRPQGTIIEFEVQLINGEPVLKGKGEVAWSQPPAKPGERPRVPGMGVRFLELDDSSRDLVQKIVTRNQAAAEVQPVPEPQAEPAPEAAPEPGPLPAEMQPRPIEPPPRAAEPAAQPEQAATNLLEIMDPADALNLGMQPQDPSPDPAGTAAMELAQPEIERPKAPELSPAEQKKRVVDCLVASLHIANVGDAAESDTLRYLLESWYTDFFKANEVDLSMLWNTLMAEEEVSVEQAALPLIVFAETQRNHGYGFVLPEALDNFAGKDQLTQLAWRRIRAHGGFTRVLTQVSAKQKIQPVSAPAPKPAPKPKATKKAKAIPKQGKRAKTRERAPASAAKKAVGVVLLLAAAAALVFSVILVMPEKASDYEVGEASSVIAIEDAKRLGSTVQAIIADEGWNNLDVEERREKVRKLWEILESDGVTSLVLLDHNALMAATITSQGPGGALEVRIGEELFEQGEP